MTDDAHSRGEAARAADARTRPPLTSSTPADADLLLQGWPLVGSPAEDLRAWCHGVLDSSLGGLPKAGRIALDAGRDEPSRETAIVLADVLDEAAASQRRDLLDMGRLGALAVRARISAGFLGDPVSCLIAANEAASRALSGPEPHLTRRYLIMERTLSNLAAIWMAGGEPLTERSLAILRSAAWDELLDCAEIVQLFRPVQGHGAVQDDTGWVGDIDEQPWDLPLPNEIGHIVLRSVDHLPGSAKAGGVPGTGSTPRAEFAPLAGVRLPLRPVPDLVRARAILIAEFPDAGEIIDTVLRDLVGAPYARIRPTLFVGAAGTGKSRFARRLAEVLGLPVTVHGCAAVADGSFIGTSRQWSTGRASVPAQTMKRWLVASCAVVLDEIDKAGTRKENGTLVDGLLPMMETEGSRRYLDPYLECETDLSPISYLATANTLDGLPTPLLDRLRIIRMPTPTRASLPALARGIVAGLREERGMDETWLPDLDGDELALVARHWPGGSVRRLRRMIETVVSGRETLAARH